MLTDEAQAHPGPGTTHQPFASTQSFLLFQNCVAALSRTYSTKSLLVYCLKKKREKENRGETGVSNTLCLQSNLGPKNTLSEGKNDLIIDLVEMNLIILLSMCFGNFITLEKEDKLLEEVRETLCILNLEGF